MARIELRRDELAEHYRAVRKTTVSLATPLSPEDCQVQSMPEASPVKWHLAHTAWFFETFVLVPHGRDYALFNPRFTDLFNSYYHGVGEQIPQADRGRMTRPSLDEVLAYREHVDRHLLALLDEDTESVASLILTGIHHEQQHQELILTDIKHLLWLNPLKPAYRKARSRATRIPGPPLRWMEYSGGVVEIGMDPEEGFCFDNECPRHEQILRPFRMASRPVTSGEFQEFVADGGYRRPELWLSDGWNHLKKEGWTAPLYWASRDKSSSEFTLFGMEPLDPAAPVCHVSYFEADAYARWAQARLPSEAEWEIAVRGLPVEGNTAETGRLGPSGAASLESLAAPQQMYGDVWEWTRSPYSAYPAYRPLPGALGEYNGKFMCNQFVLRGGSFATPGSHLRPSLRNFWAPETRWQFSGFRLIREG